eukprot:gene7328-8533_t
MENLITNNQYGKVAVLMGGNAAEREVSLKSGKMVLAGLIDGGVDAHGIDLREISEAYKLKEQGFNSVFVAMHGKGGEDGTLQGILDSIGLPYTGSGVLGSALGLDKWRSKMIWQSMGLPVAECVAIKSINHGNEREAILEKAKKLGLPLMVKPSRTGASIGMTKVNQIVDLDAALQEAFKYDDDVLIERFVTGQEYAIGILGNKTLPPVLIKHSGEFFDNHSKYHSKDTMFICPCQSLSEEKLKELSNLVMTAFQDLDCSNWGRVDVLHDTSSGKFYLLEMNNIPGMTNHRDLYPLSALHSGLNFSQLVVAILDCVIIKQIK